MSTADDRPPKRGAKQPAAPRTVTIGVNFLFVGGTGQPTVRIRYIPPNSADEKAKGGVYKSLTVTVDYRLRPEFDWDNVLSVSTRGWQTSQPVSAELDDYKLTPGEYQIRVQSTVGHPDGAESSDDVTRFYLVSSDGSVERLNLRW